MCHYEKIMPFTKSYFLLLTFILFPSKQTLAVDECHETFSTECLDWCNSKRQSGDDGPYHLDCENPNPHIYWAERCLGICDKKGCPSNCCGNRGNHVICPPRSITASTPEPAAPSGSTGVNWTLIGIIIAGGMPIVTLLFAMWYCYCKRSLPLPMRHELVGQLLNGPSYSAEPVSIYPSVALTPSQVPMASATPSQQKQEL